MIAVSIGNGSGDGPGSERGLEYDTMSGKYAEFVEAEVLPLVEKQYNVKLTKDPDGRADHGRQFRRFGGGRRWPGFIRSCTTACSPTRAPR